MSSTAFLSSKTGLDGLQSPANKANLLLNSPSGRKFGKPCLYSRTASNICPPLICNNKKQNTMLQAVVESKLFYAISSHVENLIKKKTLIEILIQSFIVLLKILYQKKTDLYKIKAQKEINKVLTSNFLIEV